MPAAPSVQSHRPYSMTSRRIHDSTKKSQPFAGRKGRTRSPAISCRQLTAPGRNLHASPKQTDQLSAALEIPRSAIRPTARPIRQKWIGFRQRAGSEYKPPSTWDRQSAHSTIYGRVPYGIAFYCFHHI
ncbi:hypothetical protein LA080_010057 [Diaporthe eres]|nr:hypothetical protein LA080_010057 [Diaporthe eres]